ncbi:F-box protein SKIP23-like [Chenopodium quinoa]|uniref:F-box domain-containing protein n=1 Tax=Chenopodium quinoa TaxID=63459 RepID=A0A803MFW9_CHEQI|nr:F-box protein SKIP23-like [Chenopodium quinoa]
MATDNEERETIGNRRRRLAAPPAGWSELPHEFLAAIAARLASPHNVSRFRSVCRKWRSLIPPQNPNFISPNFPRRITAEAKLPFNERHKYDSLFLVSSSVFVVQSVDSPSDFWVLTVEKSNSDNFRVLCPFSRDFAANLSKDFPKSLDLCDFNVTEIAKGYNFRVVIEDQKKYNLGLSYSLIPRRSLICSAYKVIMYPNPKSGFKTVDDFTVVVLYEGGNLAALKSNGRKLWYLCYTGDAHFDDIVLFKGMVCAVDRSGRVYAINEKARVVKTIVNIAIRRGDGVTYDYYMRKRLVESCGDLYLVVWAGVCAQGNAWFKVFKLNEALCRWFEVKHLGDRALFVGFDCCFFVSAREFRGCQPNRVVSQRNCFLRFGGDHISDDFLFEKVSKGVEKVQHLKDSEIMGLKPMHAGFLQSLWHFSTWNPDEEQKLKPDLCSKDAQVEDMKQTVVVNTCLISDTKKAEGGSGVVQSSPTNRAAFHGKEVRSELVPVLEKVWAKYGNIIEQSAIRSSDTIIMALESVAKVINILQNTSANKLTDHQVNYLVSTLSDLQLMQLKVDWLVPFVEKAVALNKSRQLAVALMELEKAKAHVEELKLKLLAESEKPDSGLNLAVVESISASGPIDLDKCLGEGVC